LPLEERQQLGANPFKFGLVGLKGFCLNGVDDVSGTADGKYALV
jgi:hypothetical protein